MTPLGDVPEEVLWACVVTTLRDVVVPALPSGHERDTAVQLIGLAEWAAGRRTARGDAAERARRLTAALAGPAGPSGGSAGPAPEPAAGAGLDDALRAAGELLAEVAGRDGHPRARTAAAVRRVLCDLLERDLAEAAPLLAGFAGHPAADIAPVPRPIPAAERAALARWLGDRLGGPVRLTGSSIMSGGHSRRMLRVALTGPDGDLEIVVRVEQHGMFGTDGTREAEVLRALAEHGVPVPAVLGVETGADVLGQPFFVMRFVRGSSAASEPALTAYLQALHAVHRLPPDALEPALGPVPASAREAVDAELDRWVRIYRACSPAPIPLLEEAAAWLSRRLRPTGDPRLVHGDPGPGNFQHSGGRIVALTDWEFAHYGDPAEDWAYLAAIRGRKLRDRAQWRAAIEQATGVRHDPATWHAWETFNQFKGACVNLTAARLFRAGIGRGPQLAAIGAGVHLRFLQRLAAMTGTEPAA